MFSPSVTYNPAKLRSSAMRSAGEDFISQRIDWQTRYTFSAKEKDETNQIITIGEPILINTHIKHLNIYLNLLEIK